MLKLQNYIVFLSICLLTACGGEAVVKPDTAKPNTTGTAPNKQSTGKGGYYLDDGPGDNPPANIDAIPDATLKTEPLLARSNKPYSALGQQYTPMTSYTPYKQSGVASWYGKRYHGKKTSSGEVYDMYGMSGAHTILPIPSYARVTNPANGRSVVVRINDRGPFKHDRLIDLSYAAAYKLRLTGQGSGLVEVEAIDTSPAALAKMQNQPVAQISSPTQNPAQPEPQINTAQSQALPSVPLAISKTTTAPTDPAGNYYVQAGAFKSEVNGDLLQKKIQALQLAENVGIANVYNNGLYRVKLGPYASRKEADISAANIRKQLNISAIVLNQ